MVKVYCILFDAFPLTKNIIKTAKNNNLKLLRQVGGCFTKNTISGMFTGFLPSDLEEHGIGHKRSEDYLNSKTRLIDWPWKKDILVDKLIKNKWDVKYHDAKWLKERFYYSPKIDCSTSYYANKKGKRLIYSDKKRKKEMLRGMRSVSFQNNEVRMIREFQMEKVRKNTFYFFRYDHFHVSLSWRNKYQKERKVVSAKRIINRLMKSWDFNEPNSIFWFFSDHGRWDDITIHPLPDDFVSWVLFRDNTKKPIKSRRKIISNLDFSPTILEKFNIGHKNFTDAINIKNKIDKNRIYYLEDGRASVDEKNSTTAISCKFINWKNKFPTNMIQVSYHEKDKTFKSYKSYFKKNMMIGKVKEIRDIDEELKLALINKFEWVKERDEGDE